MRNTLFIFGSLSHGMPHFKYLESGVEEMRAATICGTLYRLDSGVVAITTDGTQTITGDIVTLSQAETRLGLLDSFHGVNPSDVDKGLYLREDTQAVLESGETETVQVYALHPKKLPRSAQVIDDGDWRKSFEQKPPLFSLLTEKQRAYIQKLGASSGRDIVPIDLPLYRELMHLEIVVDKGRRLALTPLGQELYRLLA